MFKDMLGRQLLLSEKDGRALTKMHPHALLHRPRRPQRVEHVLLFSTHAPSMYYEPPINTPRRSRGPVPSGIDPFELVLSTCDESH